jgi:hypothetical protein
MWRYDDRLFVVFRSQVVFDQRASNEAKRPIYKDQDWITIQAPGNKLSKVDRPVRDLDLKRFSSRYTLFKQGKSEQQVGTPLKLLPWMPEGRVEEYRHFKIHTVEQLATAADAIGQNFMGFQTDKQKAQDYLDAANRGVNAQELEDKLSSRDEEIELLKQQVSLMMAGHAGQPDVSGQANVETVDEVIPERFPEPGTEPEPKSVGIAEEA